ncbi:MAG TPA: type II secretion system F family protein [Candidatus Wallbacteria bacterium]|nr:type II secretion system F family protein [Candidatus Wallbacteria bacterium]
MNFKVKTVDRKGNIEEFSMPGESGGQVREVLLDQGLYPLSVEALPYSFSGMFSGANLRPMVFRLGRSSKLIEFSRLLSLLIRAGMSVNEAFAVLCEKSDGGYFAGVLDEVRLAVVSGIPLSLALSRHPDVFDELFIRSVASGESAGNLGEVLSNLRLYYQKMQEFYNKLLSAAIYPIVILILSFIGITYLFINVVPTYVKLFRDMNADLPPISQFVFFIANMLTSYLIPILLLAGAFAFVVHSWFKTPEAKDLIDRLILRLPIFSRFSQTKIYSIFYRTAGLLIASGVNVITAFDVSSNVITNSVISRRFKGALKLIREGNPISYSFEKSEFAEGVTSKLVRTGEESGTLAEIFSHVAHEMDSEFDTLTNTVSSIFGPLLLILVIGVFGLIIISIMLPMITASSIVS